MMNDRDDDDNSVSDGSGDSGGFDSSESDDGGGGFSNLRHGTHHPFILDIHEKLNTFKNRHFTSSIYKRIWSFKTDVSSAAFVRGILFIL